MDRYIFIIVYMIISRWRGAGCRQVGRGALQGHLGMDSAITPTSNRFLNQDQEPGELQVSKQALKWKCRDRVALFQNGGVNRSME